MAIHHPARNKRTWPCIDTALQLLYLPRLPNILTRFLKLFDRIIVTLCQGTGKQRHHSARFEKCTIRRMKDWHFAPRGSWDLNSKETPWITERIRLSWWPTEAQPNWGPVPRVKTMIERMHINLDPVWTTTTNSGNVPVHKRVSDVPCWLYTSTISRRWCRRLVNCDLICQLKTFPRSMRMRPLQSPENLLPDERSESRPLCHFRCYCYGKTSTPH